MISCLCASQPKLFNPLDNSFLEQDKKIHKLAKQSSFYESAYFISTIATWVIAIGTLFYISLTFPIWATALAATLGAISIKVIFDCALSRISKRGEGHTKAYFFEKGIKELSTQITKDGTQDKIAQEMGCMPKSKAHLTYLAKAYKKNDAKKDLTPILARAQKCHEVAQAKLNEIHATFYTSSQKGEPNPYQKELEQLYKQTNQPKYAIEQVRQKVRSFEALRAIKWKEYIETRLSEIFTAYVYTTPVHSGNIDKVGYFAKDISLMDYLLETAGNNRNTLFAFNPHYKVISRNRFEAKHHEIAIKNIHAALLKWIEKGACKVKTEQIDLDFLITIDANKNAQDDIVTLISEFVERNLEKGETQMSYERFTQLIKEDHEELFCDPRIQKAIRPQVNAHYIKVFHESDLSSVRGRITKALLTTSKITLDGKLAPLKGEPKSLDLPKEMFTEEVQAHCKAILDTITTPTIHKILTNEDFLKLTAELEEEYYAR